MRTHSHYLHNLLDTSQREERLNVMAAKLKDVDFEAIAFQGMSGCLIAPGLAARLNKSIIMVRKHALRSLDGKLYHHSEYTVEGDKEALKYIIADDFFESGATVKNIVDEVSKFNRKAKCVGSVMSKGMNFVTLKELKQQIKERGSVKW